MKSILVKNQKKTFEKTYKEDGKEYRIKAVVRYDDECGNGHNSFSITGDIDRKNSRGFYVDDCGGCIHDEIAKHFPKLKKYIKWHLMNSDGPMHYLANTLYIAGDKDFNGLKKGEVKESEKQKISLLFDNVPLEHKINQNFAKFLIDLPDFKGLELIPIEHEKADYNFSDRYTIKGFEVEWYKCPFDTKKNGMLFIQAVEKCVVKFKKVPAYTTIGIGKESELESARSTAIWPDATLKQLQDKQALIDRLPSLIAEFQSDLEELDLVY